MCHTKKFTEQKSASSKTAKWIDEEFQSEDKVEVDEVPIFKVGEKSHPPFTVELVINGCPVIFEVDTGAAVTIVSQEVYRKMFPNLELQPSSVLLKSYTGNQVQVQGEAQVDVQYGEQQGTFTMYVVSGKGSCLLGRDWLKHIRLEWKSIAAMAIKDGQSRLEGLFQKYKEVFAENLGRLKTATVKLQIKPDTTPKFFKPRPVPYAIRELLEHELDRLEAAGIIEKVEHSEWAAPVVPVPKGDGKLRLCGDYKITINSQLLVDKYPLPRPEDLMS